MGKAGELVGRRTDNKEEDGHGPFVHLRGTPEAVGQEPERWGK